MRLVHFDSQASASASSSRPKALTSKPGISIPSISLAFLTHSLSVITAVRSYFRTRRSEEHTSELQSRPHLVCRLLLEKKKYKRAFNSSLFTSEYLKYPLLHTS